MQIGGGTRQTTATIVGNLIGANQAALARRMAINIILQCFTICLVISIPLYLYRERILQFLYGGEGIDITMAIDSMILISALIIIFPGFQAGIGNSRALGVQKYLIPMSAAAGLLEIPMALFLSWYLELGIFGLNLSVFLSFFMKTVYMFTVIGL